MSKPNKRQRWSNIDVFGLINGISTWDPQYRSLLYVRGPADSPLDIRAKIFRNHNYPGGITKQGLLNGISNEFGYIPYSVESQNVFQLTNDPFPSGAEGEQDIWVEFREVNSTGEWSQLYPQVWGSGYEAARDDQNGFIVWENAKYVNIPDIKNFNYSRTLELLEDFVDYDEVDLRISYYVKGTDEYNNVLLKKFTDTDNPYDPYVKTYRWKKVQEIEPISGAVVYTLNDIPSNMLARYYNSAGWPLEQLYTIKDYINSRYKHTWGTMTDSSVIWDIHKQYGRGNIPHFFDASAPRNDSYCLDDAKLHNVYYSGFIGGVEDLSSALYFDSILESGEAQNWFFKMYPGKFYMDGTPFYMFENPESAFITFTNGEANIPSNLERGAHVIIAMSGYYEGCVDPDPYLSGYVFEEYQYQTGLGGDEVWSNIYRRRGFIPSGICSCITLDIGEYNIDFENGKIRANVIESGAHIIWEKALVPSGRVIEYDLNPLNNSLFNKQKFFMYLVTKEN